MYNRQPRNSTWNVPSFARVTEIDMADLLKNCKMITPRVIMTNLKTLLWHTSCLMNSSNGNQGQPTHQWMESYLIRRAQRVTIIEEMTIGIKVKPAMNLARIDTLGSTV